MAKQKTKMICPHCGAAMNHHADKLVYPTSTEDSKKMNTALGGVIAEIHCCPGWNRVEAASTEKAILRYFEILEATYRSCIMVTDYNCFTQPGGHPQR